MMDDVISLISQDSFVVNEAGDSLPEETTRTVFCEVKSVGMSESYKGLGVGLNPSIKFVLADYYDYNDERIIEYNGKRYNVIRTFQNGEQLEIVAERVR